MLLLAQQQLLSAEESRAESAKPKFVAAAAGTQAARAEAARERNRRRAKNAGLPAPQSPTYPTAGAGGVTETPGVETRKSEAGSRGQPVVVPAAPGMLSGKNLGVGGLDEEIEEIRRRVRGEGEQGRGRGRGRGWGRNVVDVVLMFVCFCGRDCRLLLYMRGVAIGINCSLIYLCRIASFC